MKGKKKKKENAKCIRKVKRGDASGGLERWDSPAVSSGITHGACAFPAGLDGEVQRINHHRSFSPPGAKKAKSDNRNFLSTNEFLQEARKV